MEGTANRFAMKEWEKEQEPFQMSEHVYYVGTKYVGSYLLDTGDGLALIDQGFAETVYLLFESIRRLGFNPKDIKHLLVSHGHFDHCGGTRLVHEYSKARIYMSKEDCQMMNEHPEWVGFDYQNWIPFEVDQFYDWEKPTVIGRFEIQTIHCPGHTPGTTSFVFKDEGKVLAMHGGIGVNTLIPEFYEEFPDWPHDLLPKFLQSIERMRQVTPDIPLPSHPSQIPVLDKCGTYKPGDENPFINPQGWFNMLDVRQKDAEALL